MSDTEVVNAPAPEAALSAEQKDAVVAEFFKVKTPTLPVAEAKEAPAKTENVLAEAAGDPEEPAAAVEGEEPAKKEKTPLERELHRKQKRIDNLTRQLRESQAQAPRVEDLQNSPIGVHNGAKQDDSEPLTLSRAELQTLIDQEATKRAPTVSAQQAEIEHRRGIVEGLAKAWGREKFNTIAADLNAAFGGTEATNALVDSRGNSRPFADAILESEAPAAVIEYLADPDHDDEADALSRMGPVKAGLTVAKLAAKLAKPVEKPQPSKAAAPLESVKARGAASNDAPSPLNTKAYIAWANKRDGQRR